MTIKELEYELREVKQTLQRLQIEIDRMTALLGIAQAEPSVVAPVKWLALIGVGKEIWNGVDADAYVRKERESWN